ncbi:styrene monooxygenase/indole monooxygenase family protein, partial [Archangium sp.]|uniref:styrene monooxygenase/indole monooxygenase family protein n=1 Tax=Archangium sp. TaxID=1872627 RepID=UPI002D6D8150
EEPGIFVDYRLYHPRLAEDFMARGGHLVVSPVGAEDLEHLARRHDLVVVATGRSGLSSLFPRIPELSPFTSPQRLLFAGLARGISFPRPTGMYYSVSPGQGEIFESQMLTRHGPVTSFLIEAFPGGALEPLATRKYEEDPRGFDAMLLELLREHAPETFFRANPAEFGILGPLDLLQGGVTPVVRRGYAALGEGRFVVALGDAHVTNDPLGGQGANAASGAAFSLAEVILEAVVGGFPFDEDFCRRAEEHTWAETRPSTEWTNAMLQPVPPSHLFDVLVTASGDPNFADVAVNTLFRPELALETFATSASTAAFIARHSARARAATS